MAKDILRMSRREVDRLMILRGVVEREVTQWRAAEVLGLSERQIRRLVKRIREEGPDGIIHRSRGRWSVRKMPDETASGGNRESICGIWSHLGCGDVEGTGRDRGESGETSAVDVGGRVVEES